MVMKDQFKNNFKLKFRENHFQTKLKKKKQDKIYRNYK